MTLEVTVTAPGSNGGSGITIYERMVTGNAGWPASIDVTATDGSGSDTVTVSLTKS